MGLTKNMRRLIQFNHESIEENGYATQASSTINIKLVYQRKAKSHTFAYIWWITVKSIKTQRLIIRV